MAKVNWQDIGELSKVDAQSIGKAIIVPAKEALRQVRFALTGNLTIRDNAYAAIVTLGYTGNSTQTLTTGVEYTFQNPLKTTPIGFTPIFATNTDGDAIKIPRCKLTRSRSDGLLGITAEMDDTSSGNIGELLGPITRLRSNAISLTNGTAVNVCTTTSLTLTPGEWFVRGEVGFDPENTTSVSQLRAGTSKTSATFPATDTIAVPTDGEVGSGRFSVAGNVIGNDATVYVGPYRVNVPAGTTMPLFLVANAFFTVAGIAAYGSMEATRVSLSGNGAEGIVTGILWGG